MIQTKEFIAKEEADSPNLRHRKVRLWTASDQILKACWWAIGLANDEVVTLSVAEIEKRADGLVLHAKPFVSKGTVHVQDARFYDDAGFPMKAWVWRSGLTLHEGQSLKMTYAMECTCDCGEPVPVGETSCPAHVEPDIIIEGKPG